MLRLHIHNHAEEKSADVSKTEGYPESDACFTPPPTIYSLFFSFFCWWTGEVGDNHHNEWMWWWCLSQPCIENALVPCYPAITNNNWTGRNAEA